MCGNAGGIKFEATVLPFILRGVNILGIDSVNYPMEKREEIWKRFANEWNVLDRLPSQEVEFEKISNVFKAIQDGTHNGRSVIKIG